MEHLRVKMLPAGCWPQLSGAALMDVPAEATASDHEQLVLRIAELEEEVARLRVQAPSFDATASVAKQGPQRDDKDRLAVLSGLLTTCIWTTNAEGVFTEPQPSWQAYT